MLNHLKVILSFAVLIAGSNVFAQPTLIESQSTQCLQQRRTQS